LASRSPVQGVRCRSFFARGPMTNGNIPPAGDSTPFPPRWTVALVVIAVVVAVVGAIVNLGSAAAVLLVDIVLVALGSAVLMLTHRTRLVVWLPWIASGALLGATLVAVLRVAPWPLVAAVALAVAGLVDQRRRRPGLVACLGSAMAAAAANGLLLWLVMFGGHRPVPPAVFAAMDLRQHELLADVPLHDVWVAHLRGGPPGMTMETMRWQLLHGFTHNLTTAFFAAAAMREVLGSVFEWDEEGCRDIDPSFVHRLTEADRLRSVSEPGDSMFVYTFEREAVMEIVNCTVHALIGVALEPVDEGYDLYWAFYVKPVGRVTPFYMALIDPFRRTVIYPSLIEGVERDWAEQW